jgi:hypothetical protein
MSSTWRSSGREERGAYTSIAQSEYPEAELALDEKELEDGSMYVSFLFIINTWISNVDIQSGEQPHSKQSS